MTRIFLVAAAAVVATLYGLAYFDDTYLLWGKVGVSGGPIFGAAAAVIVLQLWEMTTKEARGYSICLAVAVAVATVSWLLDADKLRLDVPLGDEWDEHATAVFRAAVVLALVFFGMAAGYVRLGNRPTA